MSKLFSKFLVLTLVLLISSCYRVTKTPVLKYDRPFLSEYGREIKKAKKRHKRAEAERRSREEKNEEEKNLCTVEEIQSGKCDCCSKTNVCYVKARKRIYKLSNGLIVEEEQQFTVKERTDKYVALLDAEKVDVLYSSDNVGKFRKSEKENFDDIEIPVDQSVKKYNEKLGYKDYEFVNNMDMQESVDYMMVVNDIRAKKRREIVRKQKAIIEVEEKKVEEPEAVTTKVKNRFLGLFKKFFGG